jgi:hypothetical protein
LTVLSADLGGNGWENDTQFPWIPLSLFILIGLSCTDMVCNRLLTRSLTRLCLFVTRWWQVGINLAYLEKLMSIFLELPVDILEIIDFSLVESEKLYDEILARLSQDDVKRIELEQNYLRDDLSAKIADDRTQILAVLDEVRQFAKTRQFSCLLSSISKILDLIENFQNSYTSQAISTDIEVLKEIRASYDIYKDSLVRLSKAVDSFKSLSPSLKLKHRLKQLANAYTFVVFEGKDHLFSLSLSSLAVMREANLKLLEVLSKDLSRTETSSYESKSYIWTAACTMLTYLDKEIAIASKGIEIFETVEEAEAHMPMLSELEVNDFLLGLDDDWHNEHHP